MSDEHYLNVRRARTVISPGRPASLTPPSPAPQTSPEISLQTLMTELAATMRKHEEELYQKRLEAEETAYKRRKEEQRETRVWLAKTVIAPLFLLATTVFTQTLTTCNRVKNDEAPLDPEVREIIERSGDSIKRVDDLDYKVNQIGTAVIDQQVQLSESVKYLSGKIDAMSVKAQRKEEPDIVRAAAERAEEIKRERSIEDFFRNKPTQ